MKTTNIVSLLIWGGLVLFLLGIILNWSLGFILGIVGFLAGNMLDLNSRMDSLTEDSDSDSDSD